MNIQMTPRFIITSGIIAAVIASGLVYGFPHLGLDIANKYLFMAILMGVTTIIGLIGAMIPLEGAELGCFWGGILGAMDLFHKYLPDMGILWMAGFLVATSAVGTLAALLYGRYMK